MGIDIDAGRAGSYLAGLLFGIGWWLFIDGAASAAFRDSKIPFTFVTYLPGIISTLAFFLLNTLDWEMVTDSPAYGSDTAGRARVFALFCVLMSVCALVGSILVLTHYYAGNAFGEPVWPGVAVLLQNVLLFLATLVMRGGLVASATY